jgi:hypothetical protein
VAKGYSQVEGLDFGETYALVARLESIHILLAYATYHGFKLYQMDVKSAFLNGPIKEEVYVELPPGFEDSKYPNHVYKLSKSAVSRLGATARKWLGAINTTPTTSIHLTQALQSFTFNTRASIQRHNQSLQSLQVPQLRQVIISD